MAELQDTIRACVYKYEDLMDEKIPSAKSMEDLELYHTISKAKVQEACIVGQNVSASLGTEALESIEQVYTKMREYFKIKLKENEETAPRVKRTIPEAVPKRKSDIAVGIDLGTTMCCVAVFENGEVKIIPNRSQGNSLTTPSYICFQDNGTDTFGAAAKQRSYRYPETTIYDAKRMIGRTWEDLHLQDDIKSWPFEVIHDNIGNPKIKISDQTHYPQEVSARLLSHFRVMTEQYLGMASGSVAKAVITVPAYFTEPQRRATEEAATCAGLQVLNILSEPSAAAIAYNFLKLDSKPKTILIYDLGGGTFDVAIAKVLLNNVEILVVDGDTHLGGHDFDQILLEHCIEEFKTVQSIDLLENRHSDDKTKRDACKRALSRLKMQCERIKEQVSSSEEAMVEVMNIYKDKSMEVSITRDQMEQMIWPIVQKTINIVGRAVKAAKSRGINSVRDIDDVILIGGSTRIPLVIQMVKEYFDGREPCQSVDPDQAVAYGAAIQAAIYNKHAGVPPQLKVIDVLPMSIGVEIDGYKLSVVLPRNTSIPCEYTKIYATRNDMQTILKFKLYQGEQYWSYDNKSLGEFTLQGIPARAKGQEKAKVTMTIDFMGILHVSAVSLSSGKEEAITITSDKLGMDTETIERLSNKLRPRPPVLAKEDKLELRPRPPVLAKED